MSTNYLEEKIKFIRGMPKSRKNNFKNIFFLQLENSENIENFSVLFPSIKFMRDDIKFGYEYILHSLNEFDLILMDKKKEDILSLDLINSFLDILTKDGEIWFFCEKTNEIRGDNLTKEIETICFDNEIHFYKCTTHSKDFPIDVIMINKNKNK
jgi:hypothetical protein